MKCPCWYRFFSSRSSISRSIGARATKMRLSRPCSCRCYDCCLTPVIILLLMQICETHLAWWKPNSSKHRGISANSCPDHCHSTIHYREHYVSWAFRIVHQPHQRWYTTHLRLQNFLTCTSYSLAPPLLTGASNYSLAHPLLRTCASTSFSLTPHYILTCASYKILLLIENVYALAFHNTMI